jgi:hypothetical protein
MLYSFDSCKYVEDLPHRENYDAWRKNLTDENYRIICDELMSHFNENEVNTSSWIPGNDWTGTVYEPIYHACRDNVEASGLFFGLILFKMLMESPDGVWGFGRYEKDGIPIKGMTYFVVTNPPTR